jgi:hypothetical protein
MRYCFGGFAGLLLNILLNFNVDIDIDIRLVDHIFCPAQGVFEPALDLLNDALDLKGRITCPFARLALGRADYFIDRAIYSVLIHNFPRWIQRCESNANLSTLSELSGLDHARC